MRYYILLVLKYIRNFLGASMVVNQMVMFWDEYFEKSVILKQGYLLWVSLLVQNINF